MMGEANTLIGMELIYMHNQERLTQTAGRCMVKNVLFCDVSDDVEEVLHNINERIKFRNRSVTGIC